MDPDTAIGGAAHRFPATRRSAIFAMHSDDPDERSRAREAVVEAYWKPVYKYLRIKWNASNEDAKDWTQGFFARAFEKGFFEAYDPAKAAFRTFLRTCLDGYVSNERKAQRRLKRGGGAQILPLDFEGAEGEVQLQLPSADEPVEDFFHREWVRHVFSRAVSALERQCRDSGKTVHFGLFRRYDIEEPHPDHPKVTYAQLAGEFDISITDVTNYLAAVRRTFRGIVLDQLRETTASEREFQREAEALLGVRES